MGSVNWVLKDVHSDRIHEINKGVYAIGRHPEADLVLGSLLTSRFHCKIFKIQDSSLLIQDLKTMNGTYINDRKIPAMENVPLNHEDIISFGSLKDAGPCFRLLKEEIADVVVLDDTTDMASQESLGANAVAHSSNSSLHQDRGHEQNNVGLNKKLKGKCGEIVNSKSSEIKLVPSDDPVVIDLLSKSSGNSTHIKMKTTRSIFEANDSNESVTNDPKPPQSIGALVCSKNVRIDSVQEEGTGVIDLLSHSSINSTPQPKVISNNKVITKTKTNVILNVSVNSISETFNHPSTSKSHMIQKHRRHSIAMEVNNNLDPPVTDALANAKNIHENKLNTCKSSNYVKEISYNVPNNTLSSKTSRDLNNLSKNNFSENTREVQRMCGSTSSINENEISTRLNKSTGSTHVSEPHFKVSNRRKSEPNFSNIYKKDSRASKILSKLSNESMSAEKHFEKGMSKELHNSFNESKNGNVHPDMPLPHKNKAADKRQTKKNKQIDIIANEVIIPAKTSEKSKKNLKNLTKLSASALSLNTRKISSDGNKPSSESELEPVKLSHKDKVGKNNGATVKLSVQLTKLLQKPQTEIKTYETLLKSGNQDKKYKSKQASSRRTDAVNLLHKEKVDCQNNLSLQQDMLSASTSGVSKGQGRNLEHKDKVGNSNEASVTVDCQDRNYHSKGNQEMVFSTGNQGLIIILSDDEDYDIACSQMAQMSEKVKAESDAFDDRYMKIKNELAELDNYTQEVILNKEPFNLIEDDENEMVPFNSTQDIMAVLEGDTTDPKDHNMTDRSFSPEKELMEILSNIVDDGCKDRQSKETTNKSLDNQMDNENRNTRCKTPVHQQKYVIPPIVEPHVDQEKSRKMPKNLHKMPDSAKERDRKRKSSVEQSSAKKQKIKEREVDVLKRKSDKAKVAGKDKDSPIQKKARKSLTADVKFDAKSIKDELKRRNITRSEIDKNTKKYIKEERTKRLKEIVDKHSSNKKTPAIDKAKSVPKVKQSASRGTFLTTEPGPSCSRKLPRTRSSTNKHNIDKTTPDSLLKETPTNYNLRDKGSRSRCSTPTPVCKSSLEISNDPACSRDIMPDPRAASKRALTDILPNSLYDHVINHFKQNDNRNRLENVLGNINIDDVIQEIVRWLPNWLEEQGRLDQIAPANGDKPVVPLPLNFESFKQYWDSMSSMIMLEAWQFIYDMYISNRKSPHRAVIKHTRIVDSVMHMDCECYITGEAVGQNNYYKAEDFLLLECKLKDENHIDYRALSFGYVKSCVRTPILTTTIVNKKIADLCPGELHTKLEFTVITMYRPGMNRVSSSILLAQLIGNIGFHMKLFKTVRALEKSPLGQKILKPRICDFKCDVPHKRFLGEAFINKEQRQTILRASKVCLGNEPKIFCIQGPPGTGKSTVIANIIMHNILSQIGHNVCPVILVTAPSNAAVDELASKILNAKREIGAVKRHIKLVRLGVDASISPKISSYKLQEHVIREMSRPFVETDEYRSVIASGQNKIAFLKKKLGMRAFNTEYYRHEEIMLRGCNIICTTLNGCVNAKLCDVVSRGFVNFTCCIIDEATQCTEVQSLLPINLGIDKIILVGDPKQLPATVINMEAKNNGFEQSLFARLAKNFEKDPRNPITMLCEQYRMHKEICSFPNRCFYEGKLRSSPSHPNPIKPQLKPYLVFSINEMRNRDGNQYVNMDEVDMIKKLLVTIFDVTDKSCKYSIGIITPYTAQRNVIEKNIYDLRLRQNVSIVVNTVDGFQGMENDIIIISCVRYSANNFVNSENRLNVALTRAKQALYIICSHSLLKDCRTLYDLREDAKRRNKCLDIKDKPSNISNLKKYILQK